MIHTDQNGFGKAQVLEDIPQQPPSSSAPPNVNDNVPFVPPKDKPKSILKENGRLVFVGACSVLQKKAENVLPAMPNEVQSLHRARESR